MPPSTPQRTYHSRDAAHPTDCRGCVFGEGDRNTSPFVADPAVLFGQRITSDLRTLSGRGNRLAERLVDLNLAPLARRLVECLQRDSGVEPTLLEIRRQLRLASPAAAR